VTDELLQALHRLIPQVSASAVPLNSDQLSEIVRSPTSMLLVARDRGTGSIVGTLTLVIFRIPTGVRAWIEDVVVDYSVRGRGVGEALTHSAVDLAKKRGAKTIDLTSRRTREAAHRLYEKVGFVVRETSVYRFADARSEV
jgi:ribosomal protein S18 acetylase RimI-like enzyme